ncbi:MAG: MCP four helix bundle domain-containing protein, partial [Syntrophobacteraceae bacterium]
MNWFKKLRIEVKFISAFILVSTVGLAVGITGIRNMANVNEMADQIYEKELLGLSYLKEANINLIYMARAEKNAILATTEQDRLGFVDRAKKSEVIYQDYLQRAKPLFYTERGKEGFAKVEKAWGEYITVHKQVLDLALTEKLSEKKASSDLSMGLARQKIEILDKVLTDLTREKEANAKGLSDASTHLYESSRTIMIILTIVGFFAGIGLGIVMTLSVTRPIKRI